MTQRIKMASKCSHPDRPNHYQGKCKECWEWIRNPNAPCPHDDRKRDRYDRCSSCMSRYYYLRRAAGVGDQFGTDRISKGVPVKYGPEYDARRWAVKKLEELTIAQNGKCAICDEEKDLCLDHDHSCHPLGQSCEKCVRQALCHGCNMRLGQLESALVWRSLDYINKWSKLRKWTTQELKIQDIE